MGLYTRKDSPFYWAHLEGGKKVSTRVRHDAPTPGLRKEARTAAERFYHERMLKTGAADPHAKPAITLDAFLDWYEEHELPKHRGAEREREILPRFRLAFGAKELTAIDVAAVTEWITERGKQTFRKRRPCANTINRETGVLKSVLRAAVPKYLDASPLFGMNRLRTLTPKRRLLTEDEEQRLLAVMNPADTALFLLGLDALVRLGDILDARKTDDHGRELWIADPKTGDGFGVPISTRARAALDALPANDSEYIFQAGRDAKTAKVRRNRIQRMLQRYCALASPPVPYGRSRGGITFHWATRRTGATRMLTRGINPGTVQKVGRWKTLSVMLGIYHGLIDERARAAVEVVSARNPDVTGGDASRRTEANSDEPAAGGSGEQAGVFAE